MKYRWGTKSLKQNSATNLCQILSSSSSVHCINLWFQNQYGLTGRRQSQQSKLELAISDSSWHFSMKYASAIMMVLTELEGP